MAPDPPLYVSVIGAGDAGPDELSDAEAVGRELARADAIVVCGGRGGVMEAACRGAAAEGGVSVGLLPDADRTHANPFLTVAVPTGMGELRNGLVARAGDAVIAIGGEFGTLSEIGLALKVGPPRASSHVPSPTTGRWRRSRWPRDRRTRSRERWRWRSADSSRLARPARAAAA